MSTTEDTLTLSEAVALLPDAPKVHTWKNDGLGVWPWSLPKGEVIHLMQRYPTRLANPAIRKLTHALRIDTPGGIIFVETKEQK